MRQVRAQNPDRFLLVKAGDLFERARHLRGMEQLMLDMYDHPAFVDALFDRITAFNLSVIGRLVDEDIGIDGVSLSDDYGGQGGLLISPTMWRRFVRPHLGAILEAIRGHGFRAVLHSDGDTSLLLRDLVDVGVEVLHPVRSEVMDTRAIKKEYGSVLTLFGGLGTQHMLAQSKPTEIKTRVQAICHEMGRGGGFILTLGIGMNHDVPVANAIAFIEAAMDQGEPT